MKAFLEMKAFLDNLFIFAVGFVFGYFMLLLATN